LKLKNANSPPEFDRQAYLAVAPYTPWLSRYSPGVMPVCFLKKRQKEERFLNPVLVATSFWIFYPFFNRHEKSMNRITLSCDWLTFFITEYYKKCISLQKIVLKKQ
jgi:hypothetical protein